MYTWRFFFFISEIVWFVLFRLIINWFFINNNNNCCCFFVCVSAPMHVPVYYNSFCSAPSSVWSPHTHHPVCAHCFPHYMPACAVSSHFPVSSSHVFFVLQSCHSDQLLARRPCVSTWLSHTHCTDTFTFCQSHVQTFLFQTHMQRWHAPHVGSFYLSPPIPHSLCSVTFFGVVVGSHLQFLAAAWPQLPCSSVIQDESLHSLCQ